MGSHDNEIPALFTVTHGDIRNPNKKWFKGRILAGQQRGNLFIAQYEKIPEEADIEGDNDESRLCFRDWDGGYVRITVGFCDETWDGVAFEELRSSWPNGDFRYGSYMSHVSHIVLTGMLLAGI
jgi:hypothetical protein